MLFFNVSKVEASTLVFVKSDAFKITQGIDCISTFKATKPYQYNRCFCNVCGTALGELLSNESSFPVPANCFDDDLGVSNQFHEFLAEKPNWLEIGDNAKQFDKHPEF